MKDVEKFTRCNPIIGSDNLSRENARENSLNLDVKWRAMFLEKDSRAVMVETLVKPAHHKLFYFDHLVFSSILHDKKAALNNDTPLPSRRL